MLRGNAHKSSLKCSAYFVSGRRPLDDCVILLLEWALSGLTRTLQQTIVIAQGRGFSSDFEQYNYSKPSPPLNDRYYPWWAPVGLDGHWSAVQVVKCVNRPGIDI